MQQCTEITIQAQYSHCNIQLDPITNTILIFSPYILTVDIVHPPSVTGREYVGWSHFKPIVVFKVYSGGCSFFLYFVFGWDTNTPCWSAWLRKTFTPFCREDDLHSQLIMSTVCLKQRLPSGLFCVKFRSLYNSCGHSLYSSLSIASTVPLSTSEPSSMVGFWWSVKP